MEDIFDKIMREACEEVDREQAEKKAKEQCRIEVQIIPISEEDLVAMAVLMMLLGL